MAEGESNQGRPKYKRSAKNYLLDAHFQLKYTGFLVAITLVLSLALGALVYLASESVLEQTRDTVEQGKATVAQFEATVSRGQTVIEESDKVSQVVGTQLDCAYCGEEYAPMRESFKKDAAAQAAKLRDEQTKLVADKKAIDERSFELETELGKAMMRQKQLLTALGAVLLILVLAIGVAGIIFTHKIAGPIFKMKRLFRQIGEGKLLLREKLRKGDELVHFFEAFEGMVTQLREKQKREIVEVDAIIASLEASKVEGDGLDKLKKLRGEMQDHLEP